MIIKNVRRRVAITGDECDAHSRYWRRVMVRYGRAGVAKKAKRRTNRRERRDAQREIRMGLA